MFKTNLRDLKKETEVFKFGASTPGGQRANKKATGVRLLHNPSGTRVTARGRSQTQNLNTAFEELQKRLEKLNQPEIPRIPTKPSVASETKRFKLKEERKDKKTLRRPPEIPQ